ncbi:hypothetical protein G9F31_11940 [Acinetobacter sp. 187]|uniref:hypothetical protein n=1 Tax=Acinetobacter lanii TaxID=2715163 RepID=UPI0014085AF1|nr:hypothetical protein [Acinetobacter lanii]NHC04468.1 hypothetical protein [Acinetobacter lanii]
MKLMIILLFIIFLYVVWKFVFQPKIQGLGGNSVFDLSKLLKPSPKVINQPRIAVAEIISQEDIRMFDDVAKLLFEKAYKKSKLDYANQIQYEFLNKMPTQARSQINQFDFEEWSIYWSYKNQSLEYYASRYGIFYTHVDANGVEHKREFRSLVA